MPQAKVRVITEQGEKFASLTDLRATVNAAADVIALAGLAGLAPSAECAGAVCLVESLDKMLAGL